MSGYNIAILGYSVRVPGAKDVDEFWDVVQSGRDVITRQSSNVGATSDARVHAYGVLPSPEAFDEKYFGYSPREAADIDPQQRLLLECAVECLETAGIPYATSGLDIGTYCSTGLSSYLLNTLEANRPGEDQTSALIGGDAHYAATRIAYKLGLTGPAVSLGTACSSSLVAVHLAAQSLLAGECDVALAGGMDIEHPQPRSYLHQDGGIMSRTGVCRPFDQAADGAVFASGGGLVVLAPLERAQERGWPVRAILHGTAINNDGSDKASFTAPSAVRQADVIRQALGAADIDPSEVDYVECHGTGTQLGDRSELLALEEVFAGKAELSIGSLKANMGHLRVGAGVVGLIKASEAVSRRVLPPMANSIEPMPRVQEIGATITGAPDAVEGDRTLVAGVSSFGFGGTNAHAVVGSMPATELVDAAPDDVDVLRVSAPTPEACLATAVRVADAVEQRPAVALSDIAHTLEVGRTALAYRAAAVGDRDAAVGALRTSLSDRFQEGWATTTAENVVLFPGQGSDVLPYARTLYGWEPKFTASIDSYWTTIQRRNPQAPTARAVFDGADVPIDVAHAAHLAISLSIWEQLSERGLRAARFVGYSLGEYAAAAAAGGVDHHDAIELVMRRAALLTDQPAGELLVVDSDAAVQAELAERFPCAIRQTTGRSVYAVPADEVAGFVDELQRRGVAHRSSGVQIPYHSPLLADAAKRFRPAAAAVTVRPGTGFVPSVVGVEGVDEAYFATHLHTALDYVAVAASLDPAARLVDLDPAKVLGRSLGRGTERSVVTIDAVGREDYLASLAHLWVQGADLLTSAPRTSAGRLVSLPTTAFQRSPHLKKPADRTTPMGPASTPGGVRRESRIDRWMYYPSWKAKRCREQTGDLRGQRWLVLRRSADFDGLIDALRSQGIDVVTVNVRPGTADDAYVEPGDKQAMRALLDRIATANRPVDRVVHLWCAEALAHGSNHEEWTAALSDELSLGFYSLLYLVQGLAELQGAHLLHVDIVGRGMHPLDSTTATPERALLAGPALVVPQDLPFATTRSIELADPIETVGPRLLAELVGVETDKTVVLAAKDRWVRTYERDHIPAVRQGKRPVRLRDNGVYLITGGVGGIGMTIAEYLVEQCAANLVLTGLDVVPTMEMLEAADEPQIDDPVLAERTRRIRALIARGARVLTVRCDAADLAQTRQLFATIDTTFGRLDGVVHAAGVFETQRAFRGLEDTGPDDCSRRLLPKVDGTFVLAECLRGRKLDFLLMQSSLSSHLGGLGFYAYTAGNAYMDAFAERHRTADLPWMSVNWDGWIFAERDETATGSVVSPSFASPDFGVVAEIAIRPSEGAEIYGRLMDMDNPRLVLVSTADFVARIESWVNMGSIRHPDNQPPPRSSSAPSVAGGMTGTEQAVAEAWAEILGTGDLTPESNFFSIGGDSLLGVALAFTLSTRFGVVLSVITMFDNPTIAAMAREIDRTMRSTPNEVPA